MLWGNPWEPPDPEPCWKKKTLRGTNETILGSNNQSLIFIRRSSYCQILFLEMKRFTDPFLLFQPGVSVLHRVSESKEPGLPQPDGATHQVKQIFTFPFDLRQTERR